MPYLSSFLLSQRWRFQRTPLVLFRGIKSELAYTKVSGVVSKHILRPGSLWHVLSSSMLKNKLFFSLVFLKLMSVCFQDFAASYQKQAALDSGDNIYFGLPHLSQKLMVLSQLQLTYLHYLDLPLTILQNYRIAAFLNL